MIICFENRRHYLNTKYIIVAGGVISGVGKGVATASIGKILKEYGFRTTAIKIDPYINVDAGTLRPTEHGEVWVTDDGGEIDQDLGNYERFLGETISKINNITTGQIYDSVIKQEREGKFLGKTVQFIPHIPNEILERIKVASSNYDFALVEIGGTIGDYENIPFLFAAKSLERQIGKENVVYILITYLPIPSHINEMKTKPTQQAIKSLSEHGIFPDIILCRAKEPLDDVRKKKIEVYANIQREFIISAPDIPTLYKIPLNFEKEKLGKKILKKFGIKKRKKACFKHWEELVENIEHPRKSVKVAMVGKYLDIGDYSLHDVYISIKEALIHAGANLGVGVETEWINSKTLEKNEHNINKLSSYDGIIIPGGFGETGIEGKIAAIKFAREQRIPLLGLCLGLQLAVIEFARNVCSLAGANSTEFNASTRYPVIDVLPTQKKLLENEQIGGTMRLGVYAALLKENSLTLSLYKKSERIDKDKESLKEMLGRKNERYRIGRTPIGKNTVLERHRHRYEVSPEFVHFLEDSGLKITGFHKRLDDINLIEFIEIEDHPFFIATQSHPEFKSFLEDPAPLFLGTIEACLKRKKKKKR
ncbi:CTP synthase [subsurface metagenome]